MKNLLKLLPIKLIVAFAYENAIRPILLKKVCSEDSKICNLVLKELDDLIKELTK